MLYRQLVIGDTSPRHSAKGFHIGLLSHTRVNHARLVAGAQIVLTNCVQMTKVTPACVVAAALDWRSQRQATDFVIDLRHHVCLCEREVQ